LAGHHCHWTIGPIARNTPFPIDIALFVVVGDVISNEISRLNLCICKMAPIEVTPEVLAQRILALLPQDGTPVLNRVMRVMLSRQLEIQIEPELYFAARDLLLQNGKIGRSRGQSGQIFLAALNGSQPATAESALPAEPWPEARLMQPLRTYLERAFRRGLDLPADGISLVQDSSAKGPAKGLWARPDFILVSAMRFKFMPGAQVDVHSFELKTETGCSVLSVHEALAQTRFTHFGHLVWHLPEYSRSEARLAEIEDHCDEHGIGLIRMRDPLAREGCEILADPVRKSTLPMAVEGFLETRLSVEQKESLAGVVRGR
jgi:hypothetical protein